MSFQHMSASNRQAELGQRSVRIPPIPMIIRFENHLFYSDWGQQPPEQIFQHFDGDKLHSVAERVKLLHETPALAAFEPNASAEAPQPAELDAPHNPGRPGRRHQRHYQRTR